MARENFDHAFLHSMFSCGPSYSHKALRSLEIDGLLQGIITTNVDCMHTIAGSARVAEIQGSLQINRCTKCGKHFDDYRIWNQGTVPRCDECGDVIWTFEIMPQIVSALPSAPEYCALAGYSLACLFAVYAAYKTDCFSRLASGSGSLWYPEFVQFATKNRISEEISVAHFSLGDEESHTGNPYLDSVEDNTRYIVSLFSGKGIRTALYMNRGNHYQNQAERMAAGIRWILEQNP